MTQNLVVLCHLRCLTITYVCSFASFQVYYCFLLGWFIFFLVVSLPITVWLYIISCVLLLLTGVAMHHFMYSTAPH